MQKNGKRHILPLAILLWTAAAALYANPLLINSPQKTATANRVGSDADNFLSVRFYPNVQFDKFFSFISYTGNHKNFNETEMAQLGFASKFSNMYLGLYYGGNAWKNFGLSSSTTGGKWSNVYSYTEQLVDFFSTDKKMKVFDSFPIFETGRYYLILNEASVLVGAAGMGFRISYSTTYQSFNLNEDFGVYAGGGINYYKSLSTEYGVINPEFAWGMAKEIIPDTGMQPSLVLDLLFNRGYQKRESYNFAGVSTGDEIRASDNNLILGVGLNTGGYTLKKTDTFKLRAELEYEMKLQMFNNEYSYTDASGIFRTAKLKGGRVLKYDSNLFRLEQNSFHTLSPSLNVSWSGDTLTLSSKFGFEMKWDRYISAAKTLLLGSTDGTLVKEGLEINANILVLAPNLDLGMQWEMVGGKLFLNAGSTVGFGRLIHAAIEEKNFIQDNIDNSVTGKRIANEVRGHSVIPQYIGRDASTELYLGLTCTPVKYIELQVKCGVDTANAINVFNFNAGSGFLVFSDVMVTVKF